MLAIHGSGVGKGIAIGTAFVLRGSPLNVPEYVVPEAEIDTEVQRFRDAIEMARQQLRDIASHIPDNAPPESQSFIDTHLLMLSDPLIAEHPIQTIQERHYNAEWALRIHSEALARVFDEMEDPYLRNKKTDVDQITERVLAVLLNIHQETLNHLAQDLDGQIVVARDLSPADTVLLKHHKMAAFATDLGGPISHTAILARSLGIPAIVGLHGATRYIRHGETVIVDGKRGALIIGPDESVLDSYRQRRIYVLERQRELDELRNATATTRDGHRIMVMANIELPEDIQAVKALRADGVGLYRTEFLFMNRYETPSEAEQFAAYTRVIKSINHPVTVRTLDLGADKRVDGGRADLPVNPALGLRAVRLCLHEPALFKPQLRAILRASVHGPIQLMVPMLSSLDELEQVLEIIAETKQELHREGHAFDENMPIGGMIEVPAAAVAADLFASRLDFLSIGTNDLIQYTLAIDRVDDSVNYLYDPLHPSVLRLIKMTIDAGHQACIPVSMCGEMAGEPRFTRLLLGLGLRLFSMEPNTLLEVKKKVLGTNLAELSTLTQQVLDSNDTRLRYDLVERLNHL